MLSFSPQIVTNGLVFAYDAANTQKSWKGKPTENLLALAGSDAALERSGTSYPFYQVNITSVVQGRWSAGNNVLNYSFEGKRDLAVGGTAGGNDGYPQAYVFFGDWSWSAAGGPSTYSWSSYNQTFTMPNPAGKNVYFAVYHMNSGNPGKSYSRNHQVEFNSYQTPFVNGTRSNTQAILDQTNNNTITASSLTYNSDGTFSFNGNYIDINNPTLISGNNPYTIEAWYNNVSGTGAIFGNYGSGYTTNTIWVFAGGLFFNGNYYISNYGSRIPGKHHICVTRDAGGSIQVYFDGILDSSYSNTVAVSTSQNYRIGADVNGAGEPFNGSIYSVKVYNRALTSAEVNQNFQALRGRYGL